jgi:DNA polymerase-3 subunit gamma/tau
LQWVGDWPALAAKLPLRGVVQQLAQQSELLQCEELGGATQFHLRIPLETLRSAGAVDKLATALTEHFGRTIRVTTEIGAVEQTANAQAVAEREARQKQAEENMRSDPFVQSLMREFGATIVPGSIKPV